MARNTLAGMQFYRQVVPDVWRCRTHCINNEVNVPNPILGWTVTRQLRHSCMSPTTDWGAWLNTKVTNSPSKARNQVDWRVVDWQVNRLLQAVGSPHAMRVPRVLHLCTDTGRAELQPKSLHPLSDCWEVSTQSATPNTHSIIETTAISWTGISTCFIIESIVH